MGCEKGHVSVIAESEMCPVAELPRFLCIVVLTYKIANIEQSFKNQLRSLAKNV
jgi:hypothetical protein